MKIFTFCKLCSAALFLFITGIAAGYDLNSPEVFPVKYETPPAHAPLKMVVNGELNFVIAADLQAEKRMASKCRSQKSIEPAIKVLTEAIGKCTGKKVQVVDVKNIPAGKNVIVVGDCALTREQGIDVFKLPNQGFAVKTFPRGIIIAGHDSSLIEGYNMKPLEQLGARTGTWYGAYDFVERFLGVRFYFPGEYGTLTPEIKNLTITPVFYQDAPYFQTRGGIYSITSCLAAGRPRKFWEQWLGPLTHKDMFFYEKLRLGGDQPGAGGHNPRPERMAQSFPDQLKTIFYTSPGGNFWYNPKSHVGNYFNVIDLKFADLLIDSLKRYYDSNGKINEGGYACCNLTNISFGMCDTLMPDQEVFNDPVVRKLNLMTQQDIKRGPNAGMANIYARFHQYLANRINQEWPGRKLWIMAYYNVRYAGNDPRWKLPPNTEVQLCLGDLPNKVRSPRHMREMLKIAEEWYVALGNRPIQKFWTYSSNSPFVLAVNGEFVGDIPKKFGKYLGNSHLYFGQCCGIPGNMWFYYYSLYAAYRSEWNPNWNAAAAIDAHWEPFYGKETGKFLRQFHQLLRDCYMKYGLDDDNSQMSVIYPIPELEKMEKLLAQAQASVKPGTVEEKRLKLFMAPWKDAIASVRNQLSYERPVYKVYQLLRSQKVTLDGKETEAFWKKIKPMKLIDPKGSGNPVKYPAEVKLAWDKTGIYGLIKTPYKPTFSNKQSVFQNDNFELIFSPGMKQETVYQIAFDPLNQKFFGSQRFLPILQPFDKYWKAPGVKIESVYTDTQWTAEFYIPFTVFDIAAPRAYQSWLCNIVRNKTGAQGEYSGTSMTLGNNRNLSMFGIIKFAGKGE